MSDTRFLQTRIADIRERLGNKSIDRIQRMDDSTGLNPDHGTIIEAPVLCARTREALLRCRQCVRSIQELGVRKCIATARENDPLVLAHDRCSAMAEAAVRLAQTMPNDIGIQTRLSEGLEGLVAALGDHIAELRRAADRTERVNGQHASLTDLLTGLISGSNLALEPFTALADAVLTDARQGEPLRLIHVAPVSPASDCETGRAWLAQHIAAHSLNTAFVAARVSKYSLQFAEQPMSVILGALLHDVGMLELPFELMASPNEWTSEQSQLVQKHTEAGAAIIEQNLISGGTLLDAIRTHHVRVDGSGYPQAENASSPLAHLLAACDVYVALRSTRPHRSAFDSQAALTELTLMAQRGQLDADAVAILQHLTCFPIGTVVEFADGGIGCVLAIQDDQPVVELLSSADQGVGVGKVIRNLAIDNRWLILRSLGDGTVGALGSAHLILL